MGIIFETDGDGSSYPDRRWGVWALFLPSDAAKPSAEALKRIADKYEQVTLKSQGSPDDILVERDDWDEVRLRALCELHGWEFSWMTEDGERDRRIKERESFSPDTGLLVGARAVADRAGADAAQKVGVEDSSSRKPVKDVS